MKRLSRIALLLALSLLLSACAQEPAVACVHTDAQGDLLCDLCGEHLPQVECTAHADENADFACDACGTFVDAAVAGWLLADVPTYQGGALSTGAYLAGQGIDSAMPCEKENVMQLVSGTTSAEFEAYLAKLGLAGYQKEFYREADGNLFASYLKGSVRVYAYWMSRTGEARIVRENAAECAALSELAYTYQKKANEQSVLYQFALAMNDETHEKPDFKDNGMLYLLKLADHSVVIIDGANSIQMDDDRRDALMQMLWEITGKSEGETVRIAGWYITHAHGDHYAGFVKFTREYAKYLDLERIFFALPSVCSPYEVFHTGSGADGYRKIAETVKEYYADDEPLFLRLHTGQSFQLADVSFEVLQTHEDLVDPVSAATRITNYNDASTILRVSVDGVSFLLTGDAGEKVAMPAILKNWSGAFLRADGIQLAHHGMNDLSALYEIVRAEVIFLPQSPFGVEKTEQRAAAFAAAKKYARADMIFFQNEGTVGICAKNGRWEKAYFTPFAY